MRASPPKIALLGNFGTGNLGNDGSLEAMLLALRRLRPEAAITCICPNPENVARAYCINVLQVDCPRPAGAWFRILNKFFLKIPAKLADAAYALVNARAFDAVIMPGTGLLGSIGEPTFGWPYALFRWCLAARCNRARIFIVSAGAGPLPSHISRWLMKSAAAMAHYRSFRDDVSRKRLADYGLDTRNDAVYPDIAFGLPAPVVPTRIQKDKLTVGVGVMSYHGWRSTTRERIAVYEAYRAKLMAIVRWLLEQDHDVRLIIGEDTDQRVIEEVQTAISGAMGAHHDGRIVAEPALSLHDVMRQMSETDIVIATRFHNIICALMVGRPVISLGYSPPHDALMADVGLEAFCQHIEQLDITILMEQFNGLISARHECETRIKTVSARYRDLLAKQDQLISALL